MMDYFVHESSYIDNAVQIGEGTKIWHFCHILGGSILGKHCIVGNLARIIGWRCMCGEKLPESLVCERCGAHYQLDENQLKAL